VAFTFDNYVQPQFNDEHQYIVKALPVFNPELPIESKGMTAVNFLRFEKDGFYLQVTDLFGNPIDPKVLAQIEFMIEVSEYRAKVNAAVRPRIEINTATVEELRTLPRIGPEIAQRIVATRRKTRGGFKTLDDLTNVEGIGDDTLRIIEPFVTVKPK
jgi:competence ComEA-like helix-hairpin-helix protein